MQSPENLKEISFHTYSDERAFKLSDTEIVKQISSGFLTLPPHECVTIGINPLWDEDPLNDDNWRFQYASLFWLDRYRRAAQEIGDSEARSHWRRLLISWLSSNPVSAPRSDYAWFDMAVGTRVIVLTNAIYELGWTDWLEEALIQHGEFLFEDANYEGKGNHSLHQDMGLLCAGFALEKEEWISRAESRMNEMFFSAVDEQGVSQEGSLDYQYRNLRWYSEALKRLALAGREIREDWIDRLSRMPNLLIDGIRPDGNLVMWGDTNEHRALSATEIAKGLAFPLDVKATPSEGISKYDAGYLIHRTSRASGEAPSLLTSRFGPGRATAVHGHDDGGSFTWDIGNTSILRDSGIYAYEGGPGRLYIRGPESHSVIHIPGRHRYPSAGTDLISFNPQERFLHATFLSRAYKGVRWHRSFLYVPEGNVLAVDDRVVSLDGNATAEQRWQFGPQFEENNDSSFSTGDLTVWVHEVITPAGGRSRSWVKGQEDPLEGWYSPSYRELVPAGTLTFTASGENSRFSTLLVADQPGEKPEISATRDSTSMRLSVVKEGFELQASFTSEQASVSIAT